MDTIVEPSPSVIENACATYFWNVDKSMLTQAVGGCQGCPYLSQDAAYM